MGADEDHADDEQDDAQLAAIATALADAVDAALPAWVERAVVALVEAHRGVIDGDTRAAARAAGARAAEDVGGRVRTLLATDVDDQRGNPLAVLRTAVRYPAEVLAAAGVPPVVRSRFDEEAFPEDVYGLSPATWGDVDPALHERGLVWGAAKAHVVLRRRRAEGRR